MGTATPPGAAPSAPPAGAPPSTPGTADPAVVRQVLSSINATFISAGTFNVDDIADDLKSSLASVPKADIIAALRALKGGVDKDLLKSVRAKIEADSSWT